MVLEVFMGTYKFIEVHTCLHKETAVVAANVLKYVLFLCWPTFETDHVYINMKQGLLKNMSFAF